MTTDLQALLRVQEHDEAIRAIEARRDSLGPRVIALDKTRQRVIDEAGRAEGALARELDRLHALEARIAEHRQRHERNLEVLNQAHKLKEATAAMAQVETARRVLAEEESELLALSRRIVDLRTAAEAARGAADALDSEQSAAREAIAAERRTIDDELAAARAERNEAARGIDASLLSRYDRQQTRRRAAVVFALGPGFSCGSCDTAIPLQRRPAMTSAGRIETCEACGVLLYLPTAPHADN